MDFTNPEVFLDSSLKQSKRKSYDIVTLPKDSTVYRSDRGGAKDPSEGVPIFFSDRQSISIYGGAEEENVSSYTTSKPLTLFVLSSANIIRITGDKTVAGNVKTFVSTSYLQRADLTEQQREKLKTQGFPGTEVPKNVPFVIPAQPIAKVGQYLVYTNRLFAETVCKLGFDGWIALPKSLIQRNLDTPFYSQNQAQYQTDLAAGTVRYNYNMYTPEIMLCNWKTMSVRKTGGRRRKMSRKYCKKTTCKKMGFSQRASCRPYKNCSTRRRKV